MLEQPVAQVVDHPLSGVHLHLRAVRRDELVDDLQRDACDHDDDEQRRTGWWSRRSADRRVDVDPTGCTGSACRRARSRLRWRTATAATRRERFRTAAVRRAARRVRDTAARNDSVHGRSEPLVACRSSRRPCAPGGRAARRPRTRFEAPSRTTWRNVQRDDLLVARVGDVEPPALGPPNATRDGAPNTTRPSSLTLRMMPSGPTARTARCSSRR